MATKVQAATLINTVRYQTDRASLKKVRADIKNLQTAINKTMAAGVAAPVASRAAIRNARKSAEVMVDSHVKAFNDVAKSRSKQNAKNSQNAINDMFGIGKSSKSARDSASVFKASFAAQSDVVKRQTDQMNNYNKSMLAQQDNIDEIRKKVLKQRDIDERKGKKTNLNSERFGYELSRLTLTSKATAELTRDMERLNERYRTGKIDIDQYREASRQLTRAAKDQSKEFRTLGQRFKELRQGKSGGLGAGGLLLGLGVAGTVGAAYAGINAARNALANSVDTSRGLSKAQTMGVSGEEAQALRKTIRDQTGFDLSYEKIADIAKDTQDKIGQLSQGQWKQNKKDKTWSYSGGGEMSDWLKIMTERGGYSRDGAVSALRNVRGPAELAVMLQGLKKSANLTEDEFTALAEAINDFSYVAKAVGDNGQYVVGTMKDLRESGLLLTQSERDRMAELARLSSTFDAASESISGKFSAAFVDGFGMTTTELQKNLGELVPPIQKLGDAVGTLANWILRFTAWFWKDTDQPTVAGGNIEADSVWGHLWSNFTGSQSNSFADASKNAPSWMQSPQQQGGWNPYGTQQQGPVILTPAPVTVTVNPSPEFGNIMEAHANESFSSNLDNLTFDMGQSSIRR